MNFNPTSGIHFLLHKDIKMLLIGGMLLQQNYPDQKLLKVNAEPLHLFLMLNLPTQTMQLQRHLNPLHNLPLHPSRAVSFSEGATHCIFDTDRNRNDTLPANKTKGCLGWGFEAKICGNTSEPWSTIT